MANTRRIGRDDLDRLADAEDEIRRLKLAVFGETVVVGGKAGNTVVTDGVITGSVAAGQSLYGPYAGDFMITGHLTFEATNSLGGLGLVVDLTLADGVGTFQFKGPSRTDCGWQYGFDGNFTQPDTVAFEGHLWHRFIKQGDLVTTRLYDADPNTGAVVQREWARALTGAAKTRYGFGVAGYIGYFRQNTGYQNWDHVSVVLL